MLLVSLHPDALEQCGFTQTGRIYRLVLNGILSSSSTLVAQFTVKKFLKSDYTYTGKFSSPDVGDIFRLTCKRKCRGPGTRAKLTHESADSRCARWYRLSSFLKSQRIYIFLYRKKDAVVA